MRAERRKLILITGIPGTGKTTYGKEFEKRFGYVHLDLENSSLLRELSSGPAEFIEALVKRRKDIVVTWGFLPDERQTSIVEQFKARGFKLVWFDGNRPAALKAFIRRDTVSENFFYLQMYRIEDSKVIQRIKPLKVNTFDQGGQFKGAARVLKEIEEAAPLLVET